MKQSLQIKMGQSLAMTPQLQQAIKLLQLSTLELQSEIQSALDSNPMLEMQDEEGAEPREADLANESRETREANREAEKAAAEQKQTAGELELVGENTQGSDDVMPEDLPVDSAWDDIYDSASPSNTGTSGSDGEGRDFTEFHNSGIASIQDHLNEQIRFAPLSERDQQIAETIIDAIDNNGYLIDDVDVLIEGLNRDITDPDQLYMLDEFETVLHLVQHLDPAGCGARDASECMQIQLSQLPVSDTVRHALGIVSDHLDLLAAHDFTRLRRLYKITEAQLQEAVTLIRSLNPRPGRQLVKDHDQYIVPDVFVKKVKGVWRVELNPDIAPKLGINALYASMVKRADRSDDNNFMRNHLQEARWFIKSLQSRNETLLRVATAIVERQRSFLEYGDEAMKPLVLRDIAEQLSLHESTISRVTTHKYIHTPRGIFEFKYFFSSHVSTANGGECSATAIRAMIKKFIAAEDATKPLSDSKIASTLVAEGIQVARRTVAKYRESMAIPPSNERKRLS
jgi:RNA polymerase sigma-54 factor